MMRGDWLRLAYVVLPALVGMYFLGAIAAYLVGINLYVGALVLAGLWMLGLVAWVGFDERRAASRDKEQT